MRKYVLCFLMLFSLFLCSCGESTKLKSERMDVEEQNLKTQNILSKYGVNKEEVDSFNKLLYSNLFDLNTDLCDYNMFSKSLEVSEIIQSLRDTVLERGSKYIYKDNVLSKEDYISMYPLMDDNSGEIINYVIIQGDRYRTLFETDWKDGKIYNYSVIKLE